MMFSEVEPHAAINRPRARAGGREIAGGGNLAHQVVKPVADRLIVSERRRASPLPPAADKVRRVILAVAGARENAFMKTAAIHFDQSGGPKGFNPILAIADHGTDVKLDLHGDRIVGRDSLGHEAAIDFNPLGVLEEERGESARGVSVAEGVSAGTSHQLGKEFGIAGL
jgi:hypothetical protein